MTTETDASGDQIRVVVLMPRALVTQIDTEWRQRLLGSRSDLNRQVVAADVGYSDAAN